MTARRRNALGWALFALGLALPPAYRARPEPRPSARCTAPGCAARVPWPEGWREPEGKILCPAHRARVQDKRGPIEHGAAGAGPVREPGNVRGRHPSTERG